jgi:Txe/YoeB family toxin of Txe-Axe toxin-antitoxin module
MDPYEKLEEKIGKLYDSTKENSFQLKGLIENFEKVSHDLYGPWASRVFRMIIKT